MRYPRQLALFVLCLCLSALVWADPPPEFTAKGVVGRGEVTPRLLVPGAGISIFGHYLGTTGGPCAGLAPGPTHPHEICGTQVFIGDRPAELLYVSENQINFIVPANITEGVHADLRVVRNGESSAPLSMEVGHAKTMVYLDQPTYTDMPVWLRVDLPYENGTLQYPFVLGRAGFGCNMVEARKDGKPLPLLPGSDWARQGVTFNGNICGSYPRPWDARSSDPHSDGRLPLHLLYRFDVPGTYEVRFTLQTVPWNSQRETEVKARSEWTTIEILPAKTGQREAWLKSLRQDAPFNVAKLMADVLPSLLGNPDQLSFEILSGYLDDPDPSVRRYATNGLYYWADKFVSDSAPALKR